MILKCRECGSQMRLDDTDARFKGNRDEYWVCDSCVTSCIIEVRYDVPFREYWHSENSGVIDYVIHHGCKFR